MKDDINTSGMWENIMKFSTQAPQFLEQLNPFMNSLDGLSKTKDGKEAFSQIFEMFKHANNFQLNPKSKGEKKPETTDLTGNHIYDLINSPGMKDIVKEVMSTRGKMVRRKKR